MNDSRFKKKENENNFTGQGQYQIKGKGHIQESWSDWFEGLTISTSFEEENGPITTFTGVIRDQSALHGVLTKIRDINMPVISVNKIKESNHKRRKKMSTLNTTTNFKREGTA